MADRRIQTVVVVKDGEKYVFRFSNAKRKALLVALARFARNPELNFTWYDAANVAYATAARSRPAGLPATS